MELQQLINGNRPIALMSKNVLILGGNSDIGKACAQQFYKHGFSITLASRNTSEIKRYCEQKKIIADVLVFDALLYDTHQPFYDELSLKPDVVICAFGYLTENDLAITDFNITEKVLDTNFKGVVSILNVVVKDFQQKKEGTIIGISSVAADRGRASNLIYGAAKAGFDAYINGLRNLLYASQVHVITVRPGYVQTKMIADMETPKVLTSSPEQIAQKIIKAHQKKRNIVYSNFKWWSIMQVIKAIPEFIFKRLNL